MAMSYTSGRVDYNKAKIAAYIVVAGFMAIMFVFGLRSAGGPELQDGDKVESLTCPVCAGSGEGKQAGTRCQACLGSKKLKAVVPGPKHPVDVRGTVRNLGDFKDQEEAATVIAKDAADWKVSLSPVRGAVANATVTFDGPSGRAEFTSKATGKFWGVLPPGEYQVTITASGYANQQQTLKIEPRQKPIWPEAGGLLPEHSEAPVQLDILLSKS